jgi:hypothetical protein
MQDVGSAIKQLQSTEPILLFTPPDAESQLFSSSFPSNDPVLLSSIAVRTKDNGDFCKENSEDMDGTVADFCSDNSMDAYLRVYELLLGGFELDNYKETPGMTVIFFLFTVAGVLILLNILIAVVDDSYERAKISGSRIFGRARVVFVAQNEALEAFLRPGSSPLNGVDTDSPRKVFIRAVYVCRWLVLLTLISTALSAEVFLVGRAIVLLKEQDKWFIVVVSILMAVVLTASLWSLILYLFEGVVNQLAPPPIVRGFELCKKYSSYVVRMAVGLIFDIQTNDESIVPSDDDKDGEEEWHGRVNYLVRAMEKALLGAKKEVLSELQALEKRLDEKRLSEQQLQLLHQ